MAHHIASIYRDFPGLVGVLAAGKIRSPTRSMEDVDHSNAQQASDYATIGRPRTLDLL